MRDAAFTLTAQVLTVASLPFLAWNLYSVLRVPHEFNWAIPSYLIAQFGFTSLAAIGLFRGNHQSYSVYFALGFMATIFAALWCMGHFLKAAFPHALAAYVIFGCASYASAAAAVVYWQLLNHGIRGDFLTLVLQGALLVLCGSATLLATFSPLRPALKVSAGCLGFFWMAMGSFFLAYCVGSVRVYVVWNRLNSFLPMLIAILAFGFMAFRLGGLQMAAERSPVTKLAEVTR